MMQFLLLAFIGYLIGSIPGSYLVMRLSSGKDLRRLGTGNATVTAVFIHGGRIPGIVSLVAEMAKAGICLIVADVLIGEVWASLTIIVAAVLGCNWSVWLRGSGGQGQTIGMVGLVILAPVAMLVVAAFYLVPLVVTRRYMLSNMLFHLVLPIVLWQMQGSWQWGLAGFLIVAPFFLKQWLVGDDVVSTRETQAVGHNGAGV